jgi:hypothetical protein
MAVQQASLDPDLISGLVVAMASMDSAWYSHSSIHVPGFEVCLLHALESEVVVQSDQGELPRARVQAPGIVRAFRRLLVREGNFPETALTKVDLTVSKYRVQTAPEHCDGIDGSVLVMVTLEGSRTVQVWIDGVLTVMECTPGHIYLFDATRHAHQVVDYSAGSRTLAFRWLDPPACKVTLWPTLVLPDWFTVCAEAGLRYGNNPPVSYR